MRVGSAETDPRLIPLPDVILDPYLKHLSPRNSCFVLGKRKQQGFIFGSERGSLEVQIEEGGGEAGEGGCCGEESIPAWAEDAVLGHSVFLSVTEPSLSELDRPFHPDHHVSVDSSQLRQETQISQKGKEYAHMSISIFFTLTKMRETR